MELLNLYYITLLSLGSYLMAERSYTNCVLLRTKHRADTVGGEHNGAFSIRIGVGQHKAKMGVNILR